MSCFKEILLSEMLPALGCTEPIALALCAAKAMEVLDDELLSADVFCSANIIKNVKAVVIPNSNGKKGIEIACCLGFFGGDASKYLNVLQSVKEEDRIKASQFIEQGKINVELEKGEENLYIRCELKGSKNSSIVELKGAHTNITKIIKNKETIFLNDQNNECKSKLNLDELNVKNIYEYANSIDLFSGENKDLLSVLKNQIECNYNIAQEGLNNAWGAQVGKTLDFSMKTSCVEAKTIAYAAAGSDARMSGCSLPVVINSGSGNQGITIAVPLVCYAKENNISDEKLYRSLIFANLLAIHQKRFIGKLSAFCGAVSAAAASGAGLGYMQDLSFEIICNCITNTLATSGGMVCDGAKPSCAAKIAVALNNACLALNMSKNGFVFESGDGIVGENIEQTIKNIGHMGRVGMAKTDEEILKIMLNKI